MTTPTRASTSGNSYEIICPAERRPPISEYLLFELQPAMITPTTSIELIATRKIRPVARGIPGSWRYGESGRTAKDAITGAIKTDGAIRKSALSVLLA